MMIKAIFTEQKKDLTANISFRSNFNVDLISVRQESPSVCCRKLGQILTAGFGLMSSVR